MFPASEVDNRKNNVQIISLSSSINSSLIKIEIGDLAKVISEEPTPSLSFFFAVLSNLMD